MRVVGLMSGTSLDGIDAALIEIDGGAERVEWRLLAFETVPFTPAQRQQIHDGILAGEPESICRLHASLGEWLAEAVHAVCARAGVPLSELDLIGSHGQTLWHDPPAGNRGSTMQIGCPATIAERTGVPVVSDFRTRDMAAWGQGAPLVPWADRHLYGSSSPRALLNIGGMANVTYVPARDSAESLLAFDTGPGNALIDAAVELTSGGSQTYDLDGRLARAGTVDESMLAELFAHPFFAHLPPKSTGREVFGRPFVQRLLERHAAAGREARDLVATVTALTARSIIDGIRQWVLPRGITEVVVTGGGARNSYLLELLRAGLPVPVVPGESVGIDSDAKEAVAFAALAWAHVRGIPGNVPEATGARGARILGSHTPAGPRAGINPRV